MTSTIRQFAERLGYLGRTGRRVFAVWAVALLAMLAFLPGKGGVLLGLLMQHTDGATRIAGVVVLTVLVCAIKLAWIWGVTVLPTRRVRDAGGPIWLGVASALAATNVRPVVEPLLGPEFAGALVVPAVLLWLLVLTVWPPRAQRGEVVAVFA